MEEFGTLTELLLLAELLAEGFRTLLAAVVIGLLMGTSYVVY